MLAVKFRISKRKPPSKIGTRRIFDRNVNLKFSQNAYQNSRFSVVVGKVVSKKATVRNQIKRQVKNFLAQNLDKIKSGLDVIIIIKKREFKTEELDKIFQKSNILK